MALRSHFWFRESSIGIHAGPSPLALGPVEVAANPVLTRSSITDVRAVFVADPFMTRVDGTWYMFFEVLRERRGGAKGEIGLATSPDGLRWTYQRIVLAEPFHLSYPYVLERGSEHYMVPESAAAGAVRLYRADRFPDRWVFVKNLLTGPAFLDSSVFSRDGDWWMFTETSSEGRNDTLRLFRAADLLGPWAEHPRSPVVRADARIARPAGRVLCTPDRLVRFAQDCRATYGKSVYALEITRLDDRHFEEVQLGDGPVLAGGGHGWCRGGMHHVDPVRLEGDRWIACVDGWYERRRTPAELVRSALRRWW
jgi:hypothetical protein